MPFVQNMMTDAYSVTKAPDYFNSLCLYLRIPVEMWSLRDRAAVGRFPSVSFGVEDNTEEDREVLEENTAETENACWRWLRNACSCCCSKPGHSDTLIKETVDEDEEDEDTKPEKPATDVNELNGK